MTAREFTKSIERYLESPLVVCALWQPWATLCVASDPANEGKPAKRHETRHWAPRARPPFALAIQATKTVTADTRAAFTNERFKDALRRCGFYPGDPRPLLDGRMRASLAPVPLGAIIGVATVAAIYRTPGSVAEDRFPIRELCELTADDRAFGDYTVGRFAWQLADAIQLPDPIPFTGRQEPLYPVDVHTLDQIRAQLRGMVP